MIIVSPEKPMIEMLFPKRANTFVQTKILQDFHFHFWTQISIKLNRKKSTYSCKKCFACADNFIGLEQAYT